MQRLISSENVLRKSTVFVPTAREVKILHERSASRSYDPDSLFLDIEVFIINTCLYHSKLLDDNVV